jgi:hypothetical protein
MTEYQYYEWRTIDRRLTKKQIAGLRALSAPMDIVTPVRAMVTYTGENFQYDPEEILAKYFDAFLYLAHWGTRRLVFRFSRTQIDANRVRAYCLDEWLTLTQAGEDYLLEIATDNERGSGWIEGEGTLEQLIPLRAQILLGDYRALYLTWLNATHATGSFSDEDDEENGEEREDESEHFAEPPVPGGLQYLTPDLKKLIQFLEIDPHLVAAAAAHSHTRSSFL